jgi:RimJ/RimL family protein N-acetyltransferase
VNYSVRRLTRDDVDAYRAIRLEALTNHPEAFASSAEDFVLRSIPDLEGLLEKLVFLGAVLPGGELAGIMAYDRGQKREAHRGWLFQVYVKPAMRGTGCAKALLDAVIAHAQAEVLQLHLSVASHNEPALRLYQRAGFVIYGTDPRFQRVNGRFVDEHLMVRFFDKAPGKTEND